MILQFRIPKITIRRNYFVTQFEMWYFWKYSKVEKQIAKFSIISKWIYQRQNKDQYLQTLIPGQIFLFKASSECEFLKVRILLDLVLSFFMRICEWISVRTRPNGMLLNWHHLTSISVSVLLKFIHLRGMYNKENKTPRVVWVHF